MLPEQSIVRAVVASFTSGRHNRASRFAQRVCTARAAVDARHASGGAPPARRRQPKVDGWQMAREFQETGQVHEGMVKGVNKGGILLDCWGVRGFIPNSMLVSATARPEEGMRVKAMFVEVNELENRMILSQKQVYQAQLLAALQPGQVVQGTVAWLESYGAFVDIKLSEAQSVSGMIHISELSWSRVVVPDTVVSVGEWLQCKVVSVEPARGRLHLSLKQMQPDPLTQNVETVLPVSFDEDSIEWKDSQEPLPGLQPVVAQLLQVDGITDIKYGRQANLPGHVSQDLELWLSRQQVQDHWNVVARSMSAAQELAVFSSLEKDELKKCLDMATSGKTQGVDAETP